MPIDDVETRLSPGWWLMRLSKKLADPRRQKRLKRLKDRVEGRPPLPVGAENCREAFEQFQRKARSNFAALIPGAMRERMRLTGIRTGADSDEAGDGDAWDIVERSGMEVVVDDVHDLMLTLGEGYCIVGDIDPDTGVPLITAEDPRETITAEDPATGATLAGLKLLHDDVNDLDLAYLYLRGVDGGPTKLWVAQRPNVACGQPVRVNARAWSWDENRSTTLDKLGGLAPIVRFPNRLELGEFEPHEDLLDRINHMILQRMVIATLQAFKQYAAIGLPSVYPPGHPKAGQEIDYRDVFNADPGAIWQLPAGTDMWESAAVDLTPILSSTKDDVQHLSAVTATPMHVFDPTSANQSAEGAGLTKEGIVFKVEDRLVRVTPRWSRVMSLAFRWMGDVDRANLAQLRLMWADPARPSLLERAQTAGQATDIPWRTKMIRLWQFPPSEVDRMESERAADKMLEAAFTNTTPAPDQAPAPQPAAQAQPSQQQPAGNVNGGQPAAGG